LIMINPGKGYLGYKAYMTNVPLTTSDPRVYEAFRRHIALGDLLSIGPFRAAFMIILAAIGLYVCFRMMLPFLTPVVAAFVLAVLFSPFHRWISARVARPNLAALVSVFTIAGLVFLGATLLVAQLVHEGAAGANLIRAAIADGFLEKLLSAHPRIAPMLHSLVARLDAPGLATDATTWITNASAALLRGSVFQVVGAFLTFYLLYYFLRDRDEALSAVQSFLPLTGEEANFLFSRAIDTVHATVYGMVVTGLLVGLLGGVIFAIVGLPAPVLWGSIMAAFAILPVLGTGMIWIPAVLILVLDGEWARASILAVAFTGLAAANGLFYPYLVGDRMKLHTAVAFIAAVGGLLVFGAVGFVLGPLVIAVTLALRDILQARLRAPIAMTPLS